MKTSIVRKIAKFPGWRTMTAVERRNARMHAMFERARLQGHNTDKPSGGRDMNTQQATQAMENHTKVQAGQGEDRDIGIIHSIDGDMAMVGWQSGVNTPCPIADLTAA